MHTFRRRLPGLLIAFACLAGLGPAGPAHAQADYPVRPIRLVVGFPPAGSGDFIARSIGEELGKLLGQPVVVDNRPGADTNIASETVARAAPDGYTLLLGGSFSHSVNPALFSSLRFDVARDFTPIGKVAALPTVFAVPAALPVNTMQEFLAYAKREGDRVNYGSAGTPGHIAAAYLNKTAGLKMTHIPYKGAADMVRAMIAGDVQLIVASPPSIMPFMQQGRVKALALTTAAASPVVPGVPGAADAGLKDFEINGWYALYGPARMPAPIVARLHAALEKVLAMPAMRDKLAAQGVQADPSPSVEAFSRFAGEDRARWVAVVKDSGVKVEQP